MPIQSALPIPVSADAKPEDIRIALRPARQMCRLWAGTVSQLQRSEAAALFTQRALQSFALQLHPNLKLSPPAHPPQGQLDSTAISLADNIGREATALPLDEGLHFITSLYPAMLPQDQRGALGAFYTPPALVRELLDRSEQHGVDWLTARVLDPASGGGAFLVGIAMRMRHAMAHIPQQLVLRQIQHRLVGFELDPHAAALAQSSLEILLGDLLLATGQTLPAIVHICDTLEEEAKPEFDLVVGNPPYGRIKLPPEQRQRYARSLYGHANLYGVFTDIALRWTTAEGCIAYVTPTSFLAGNYFSALRALLAREAPPHFLGIVHARTGVFEDVQQETVLTVSRKSTTPVPIHICHINIVDEAEALIASNGTIRLPVAPGNPWIVPRTPAHSALANRITAMPCRLADWGHAVSTGPLVWNRHKDKLRSIARGKNIHPLIWSEAVTADGEFLFRAEKRNHQPYFKAGDEDQWMVVLTPCVLVQRTTSKEQSRRLLAAELPESFIAESDGVVIENHLNMIRPCTPTHVPLTIVAALLNSKAADQAFRCISGSVAVSAFELESLPLPAASELESLTRLVEEDRPRSEIEAECFRLYGLSACS